MKKLVIRLFLVIVSVLASGQRAEAISFNLDSIAEWGKFPRFCVNTYRWGDKFFNSYDSTYVVGTGTKFNVKIITDSWLDYYRFTLPENQYVDLVSDPSTSIGAYLTYLAVSVGYDINISNLVGGVRDARSRYQFGFNCSLLGVEAYIENNEVGTKMTRFGDMRDLDIPFNGIKVDTWGIDAYYFFNHKRYSQAAAFNFSKIQRRSQGSFYAGLSIYSQGYDFDFSGLDPHMLDMLPEEWNGYHYRVKTTNYGFRLGYGYNWALGKKWLIGVSVSPTIGFKVGFVNSDTEETSFSLYNRIKFSAVWNHGYWFIGGVGNVNSSLIADRRTTFLGNIISGTVSVGYRFNLW